MIEEIITYPWTCIFCYTDFEISEDINGECPHCKEKYIWDYDGDYGEDSEWWIRWIKNLLH